MFLLRCVWKRCLCVTIFECDSVVQNSVGVVGPLNASHLLPGLVCVCQRKASGAQLEDSVVRQ